MIIDLNCYESEVHNVVPFTGTKLFEQAIKDNLFIKDINPQNFWQQFTCFTSESGFYIKPYNMSVEDLYDFRKKIDKLVPPKYSL